MERADIETMMRRLTEELPASLQAVRADLEAHASRVLRSGAKKLDLVSREEFDAQSRVLERSRALIDALQERVAVLEEKLRASGN
jgi:ubiquinone biosynthesis accessory factor UbiK